MVLDSKAIRLASLGSTAAVHNDATAPSLATSVSLMCLCVWLCVAKGGEGTWANTLFPVHIDICDVRFLHSFHSVCASFSALIEKFRVIIL